jgi:hypothetical protein
MFVITLEEKGLVHQVIDALYAEISESRFKFDLSVLGPRRIRIQQIRLRESKKYCGSHPYACDIENGRRGPFLEGSDWVEFNDRLNDVLDSLELGANVRSALVQVRDGRRRRVFYDGYLANPHINEFAWNKTGNMETHYEDWCGKIAPNSEYPLGTPGLYERELANVD